jgi:hypothetical protein
MDKRLPDDAGMWYSDYGQECYIQHHGRNHCRWPNSWYVRTVENHDSGFDTLEIALERAGIRPARWRKVEAPEFEPLPVPLPRVLFTHKDGHWPEPFWGQVKDGSVYAEGYIAIVGQYRLVSVVVVPHPANDPEAVRLIEEAHAKLAS